MTSKREAYEKVRGGYSTETPVISDAPSASADLRAPTPKRKREAATKAGELSTVVVCDCGEECASLYYALAHIKTGKCDVYDKKYELRKRNGVRLIAKCGTHSGYRRHQRRGEDICEPCRVARNEYERSPERVAAKKERANKRYAQDPEYRKRQIERTSKRYAEDEEYRLRMADAARRRREDPEYRKRLVAQQGARRRRRYAEDPEFRAAHLARGREYRARKKAEKGEVTG